MSNSAVVGILRAILTLDSAEYESATKRVAQSAKAMAKDFKTLGNQATALGSSLTKTLTLPIVAGLTLAAKASIDFESSFAGVRKTVDGTDADFQKLAQTFRNLAKTMPVNVNELNRIGEAAGALGIKKEDIGEFTEVMAKLGATTNLTSDQAATSIAQIQNIFDSGAGSTKNFAAALVALGNDGASTEAQIVDFTARLAGAGHQIGLTQQDVMGFGAALANVGLNAELGGTAFSTVMSKMSVAVDTGGEKLKAFADTARMSSNEFKNLFKTNATEALIRYVEGLDKAKGAGENLTLMLREVGLKGSNVQDVMKRLAGAGDEMRKAVEKSNDEWKKGTALNIEFAKRADTTASKLKVLFNIVYDLAKSLGDQFKPAIDEAIKLAKALVPYVEGLVKGFAGLPVPLQLGALAMLGIVAAAGPTLLVLGQLFTAASQVAGAFTAGGIASKAFAAGTVPLNAAFFKLGLTLAPIALAAALITRSLQYYKDEAERAAAETKRLVDEQLKLETSHTTKAIKDQTTAIAAQTTALEEHRAARNTLLTMPLPDILAPSHGPVTPPTLAVSHGPGHKPGPNTGGGGGSNGSDLNTVAKELAKIREAQADLLLKTQAWAKFYGTEIGNLPIKKQEHFYGLLQDVVDEFGSLERAGLSNLRKVYNSLDINVGKVKDLRDEFRKVITPFDTSFLKSITILRDNFKQAEEAVLDFRTTSTLPIAPINITNLLGGALTSKDLDAMRDRAIRTADQVKGAWTRSLGDMGGLVAQLGQGFDTEFGRATQAIGGTLQAFQAMSETVKKSLGANGALSMQGFVSEMGFVIGTFQTMMGLLERYNAARDKAFVEGRRRGTQGAVESDFADLGQEVPGGSGARARFAASMRELSQETLDAIDAYVRGMARSFGRGFTEASARAEAEALHLTEIIEALGGLTQENLADMERRTLPLFDIIARGGEGASAATEELGRLMTAFAGQADKAGGLWDTALLGIIQRARDAGVALETVNSLIQTQLDKIGPATGNIIAGFTEKLGPATKAIAELKAKQKELEADGDTRGAAALGDVIAARTSAIVAESQAQFDRLSRIALASFNAYTAQGQTAAQAISNIGPAIDALKTSADQFGFAGSEAFNQLSRWRDLVTNNEALLGSVAGLNDMMTALANMGALDAATFSDLQAQGVAAFAQLTAAGFDQHEALSQMAPLLENIVALHEERGLAIDDETKALIDQAREDGVLKAKQISTNDLLQQGFTALLKGLKIDLPEAWRGLADDAEAAAKAMKLKTEEAARGISDAFNGLEFRVPVSFDVADPGSFQTNPGESGGEGTPGFARGSGGLRYFNPAGSPAMLHGHEEVLTAGQGMGVASMVSEALRGGVAGGGIGPIHIHSHIDGREAAHGIVPHIQGAVRRYGIRTL